jgi:NADH dehydrogenase FAD-containing subunit
MQHQYSFVFIHLHIGETYTLAIAGAGTAGLEVAGNVRSTLGYQREILFVHRNFYFCFSAKNLWVIPALY